MHRASRRSLLAALIALGAAAPALAEDGKTVELKRVFPFLQAYLKIPPADRSRFTLSYYLRQDGKPFAGQVWIIDDGQRTPVPIAPDGRIERLPTLAQLDGGRIHFDAPEKSKMGVSLEVQPLAPPAVEMSARELAAAVAQAAAGARKVAGVMSFAVPKLDQVSFPGAPSGEVIFADGRRAPLPMLKGAPVFEPAKTPGAATLRFPKAPMRVLIG